MIRQTCVPAHTIIFYCEIPSGSAPEVFIWLCVNYMTNEKSITNNRTLRGKQRSYLKALKAQSCPCLEELRKPNLGQDNHFRHDAGKLTTTWRSSVTYKSIFIYANINSVIPTPEAVFSGLCNTVITWTHERLYQSSSTSHVTQIDLYQIRHKFS
jgi:hypothetical protein